MPKVKVDGVEIEVPAGATVLQACELAGKEIPRFCYHERLTIAGNCRMCLVEVKPGPPKPQASCALPIQEGQEILTNSPMVKKAREGVMEFLLINHPLDCPICDQGGECDLQDQAIAYGRGHSRFQENKRAVTEKYMGPVVKTIMTRCIQCTRCVRFAEEVAGVEEIGAINRGENMEITSYLEGAVTSELSGNIVDLCPVGALVSKPYSFEARPWELRKTPGIDVMDAVGTNIRIDSRQREVMRALPRLNEDVNEEWAHDKTRHAVDGLVRNRLDQPWVRVRGKLQPASWEEAFAAIARQLKGATGDQVAAIAGDLQDLESIHTLKALLGAYGSTLHECRQDGASFDVSSPAAYRFAATIAGIENAGAILLVGSNPRWEAPLVNTRIRKAIKAGAKVFHIGPEVDLTYPAIHLGTNLSVLGKLPKELKDAFNGASDAAVIVGMGALVHEGAYEASRAAAAALGASFNLLHTAASRVGALDLGFTTEGGVDAIASRAGSLKALFLLGADEIDTSAFADTFTIYVGTHGDRGVKHADVILP
ncbi:MAG: NADH-quinone oxidoreductase subunit NuoG, partial [Sphingomonadales bacterium]